LGANRIHITVALRSNDNFIPLPGRNNHLCASQSQYSVCIRIILTHTERRLNRSLTNIMRAFCARGAAAPNEKKKIMNGCCWCFFSSSSISFFRHASLDAARDATLRSCAVYIYNFQNTNAPPMCVFCHLRARHCLLFCGQKHSLSGRERGE
jgi:hypothetical protein